MKRSEEKIIEIRLNKMHPSLVLDDTPHGTDCKYLSDYAVALEEAEQEYFRCRYLRIKKCEEISKQIELLKNENEKDVLTYQYIKNLEWEKICVKLNFSWSRIHEIHRNALRN